MYSHFVEYARVLVRRACQTFKCRYSWVGTYNPQIIHKYYPQVRRKVNHVDLLFKLSVAKKYFSTIRKTAAYREFHLHKGSVPLSFFILKE